MKNKLIKMLKKAHAGEIGAWHAYEGHLQSLEYHCEEWKQIHLIQNDELQHRIIIRKILAHFGSKPSKLRDFTLTVVGIALGALCLLTGWLLPMKGALLIEKIGVINYAEMVEVAIIGGFPDIGMILLGMAAKEQEHKEYFEKLIYEYKNNRPRKHLRH